MISSTFADMKQHRAALIEAVVGEGLTAVAMESDAARPDVDVIDSSLRMVREASAYIGVISRKYGQTPECPKRNPGKLSLTELEFNEAQRLGRPTLLFIMGPKHPVIEADVELDAGKREKLNAFREWAKKMKPDSPVTRVYATFDSLEEFTRKAIHAAANLRRYLDAAPLPAPTAPDPIPAPPAFYAEPAYIGSHQFLGRQAQLDVLSDWAVPADAHPVLLFDAIGGSGKSMLTWEWTTKHATLVRADWAGRFWYSFYERGGIMADFCRRALAYITREPLDSFRKMKTPELGERLLRHLQARPWLLVLDGLERVLVAYHRFDAAKVPDEAANQPTDQIAQRDPCAAIRPEDDDLIRALAAAAPSKLLITSRLVPSALLNSASQPVHGVLRVSLPGLRPADAEALLRSCGVTGDSQAIQNYLKSHCDCHPLVTGVLASLINAYLPDKGNFDAWAADPDGGGRLNLANIDLIQKRNHILKAALDALPEKSRQFLSTLALLSEAVDYPTLSALNPHLPPEPKKVEEPNDPKTLPQWKRMSPAAQEQAQQEYQAAIQRREEYEQAVKARLQSPEFLSASRELANTVHDLERRGLLQYDSHARRYDLHPVVRGVAAAWLRPVEKGYEQAAEVSLQSLEFLAGGLVDSMARGDAVLFAGAGVGAQAGLPLWRTYVEHLFDVARTNALIDDDLAHTMRESLDREQYNDVADSIALRTWPNTSHRQIILSDLRRTFDTLNCAPSRVHWALAKIPFRSVLTTNFDSLLDRAFAGRGPTLLPQQIERLKELIAKKEFFGLHLYGMPESEESLLLTSLQFSEFLDHNIAFGEALASLFVSSPFFFVGCSFEGIQGYLKTIRVSRSTIQHYALMDVSGEPLWKTKADVLKLRYGITVIPYELDPNGASLYPAIETLARAVADHKFKPQASPGVEERPLRQVVLKNIGAFEELQLRFLSQWTLLIGPNGVGKSTILRAIATAFAGETAGAPPNLLRGSATEGRIEIQTARQTAVVSVRSTGRYDPSAQVRVDRSPDRPLEFEPYPVLAFPALRAFSGGGTALPPEPRAVPEDVLPMAINSVDGRLSDLKIWLINLEHKVKDERHTRVRDYFFEALGRLAIGVSITPSRVDPDRSQVVVRTADGEVPIETVSQGSASLMCWIGVLLQRLADIHYDSPDPWNQPALVLIDEIDTHMHPLWQRLIVHGLKELFPRVQFVATTHSPLLVADLPPESIVVLRRDGERVTCAHLDPANDVRGLRADQILLGEVFGLDGVRGPEMEQDQKRYVELSLNLDRTADEEAELVDLANRLNLYRVTPEETREAREAARLIEKSIDARIDGLDKERLIEEIRTQMLEIKSAFRQRPPRPE
jgi:energy-coupling factor transporter ATP-binding protein EcfA2